MRTDLPQPAGSGAEPATKPARAPKKAASARVGWEEFLLGRKSKAARFVEKLRRGPKPVLDSGARVRLAAETISQKDGIERLLDLVQASVDTLPSIRETALDLATAGIEAAGIVLPPLPSSQYAYAQQVLAWLETTGGPLKAQQLRMFMLLLHVGVVRYSLDRDTAFDLLRRALAPKAGKRRERRDLASRSEPLPEDVLILADPVPTSLITLLQYEASIASERKRLERRVEGQAAEVSELHGRTGEFDAALQQSREEIRRLQKENEQATAEIERLKKEVEDVHGDYKFKLYDLRGHVRGALGGQLTQWLRTALDASCASPPRAGVIQERLEDALAMIEKEMRWLQPSD
jgi:hypothetical protein